MFRPISLLMFWTLTGSALEAKSPQPHAEALSFQVRLQDYAGLPKGLRKLATATASQVFRRAGVSIDWLNCTPSNPRRDGRCAAEMPRNARVLRILPPEMTARMPASGIEFGRAQLTADGSRGTYASVYWGRVQALARGAVRSVSLRRDDSSTRYKEGRILGYVLAHELAHLLGVHHGKAGVMHGPWSPSELAGLLLGTLRFQKTEEEDIRAALASTLRTTNTLPMR